MSQSNRIIRLCNRCIRREREKYDMNIHNQCTKIRMTKWNCPYYYCKIQDNIRIGKHTFPIDIVNYTEKNEKDGVLISGNTIWQKNTPKEGEIALLPLYLLDFNAENKTFAGIGQTLTDAKTGYFEFFAPYKGEFYIAFKLDDVSIFNCKIRGIVTGHECQLCFHDNEFEQKSKYNHLIRCRRENVVEQFSFEFIEDKQLFEKINPILNV